MKENDNYQGQIYKLIRRDINDDVKNGRKRSHNDYMLKCEVYFTDLCNRWKPGSFRFAKWKHNDETATQWQLIKGYFDGVIEVLIQEAKARNMIREINTISTKSLVSSALKEAGMEFQYEAQQYRAKVSIKLTSNSKLVLYINYKKAAGQIPVAVESAKEAKELLARLGNSASFKKCTGWEEWI